jgi:sulfite reductase (NADPH) flavoprotein alpha-component
MSAFAPRRYARAAQVIVLAATYGDGAAPASAKGFLDRLTALAEAPGTRLAVLGFGDRSFPAFCGFAEAVARAAEAKGWPQLLPLDTVDRQSPQDFARWGQALGAATGLALELNHQPVPPRARPLALLSRRDYGGEVQAPTVILRFALPRAGLWQRLTGQGFPRFAAADLLGILPEGSVVPRFYSLASASQDGFAEICVRKHPGGLCSGQLLELQPGEIVRAFIRRNPDFRPAHGRAPVILIGAGTGIGPLAGFARANAQRRPMHLYFGARHPESDLLYGEELASWRAEGRLASVTTAFSRTAPRAHVQDALRRNGAQVARLVADGAQVLVCGGREMAVGVAAALAEILAPHGLTPTMLKAKGRYAEDVY